jgi:hypothetical protein
VPACLVLQTHALWPEWCILNAASLHATL